MRGSKILLSTTWRGLQIEGIIAGSTCYPGMMMQLVISALNVPVNGRQQWQPYGTGSTPATGDPRLTAILLEDDLQGILGFTAQSAPYAPSKGTAYVSGTRCRMYVPGPGEEMNILLAGSQGTSSGNAFTIGERLVAAGGGASYCGQFVNQSTSSSIAQFMSMEHLDEVPDTASLCWAMRQ